MHTLGALYESMLREMRDAAGDSGEFYTPRAVVRLMVAVTGPRLGESVIDPASGTGGFLVEAYNHLAKQVKTVANWHAYSARPINCSRFVGPKATLASESNVTGRRRT